MNQVKDVFGTFNSLATTTEERDMTNGGRNSSGVGVRASARPSVRLALARGTATAAAILSGNDKNNEPKRQRRRRHTSPVDMYPTGWVML